MWISIPERSGDRRAAGPRDGRGCCRRPRPRGRGCAGSRSRRPPWSRWRRVGSVIASSGSPATSETRQVDQPRGGDGQRQAAALEAGDLLADRVDLGDRQARRRAAARGGRASPPGTHRRAAGSLSAELPPVKQAMTRSRSPSSPACSSSQTAAATLRSSGSGWAASSSSIRSSETRRGAVADDDGPAVQALAEDPLERERDLQAGLAGAERPRSGRRGRARWRTPSTTSSSPSSRDQALDGEARVAGGQPGLGHAQGEAARLDLAVREQGLAIPDRGRSQLLRRADRGSLGAFRLPFARGGRVHLRLRPGPGRRRPG